MTDTEIKELFEANGQFATGKDYALIRAFETIIRQQRTWVGLTLEDKEEYLRQDFGGNRLDAMDWAARKLKEKNT